MEPITITTPITVPATQAKTYDRWGTVQLSVTVDKETGKNRVSLTPCAANATEWSPANHPEVVVDDLAGEIGKMEPDDQTEAATAVQAFQASLLTIQRLIMKRRELL